MDDARFIAYISFMSNSDLLKAVADMVERVGKSEARRLLVVAGISPHTANTMTRGKYTAEIKLLVRRAILEAVEASKQEAS